MQSLWYDVSCTAKEPTGSVAVYGQGNTSKKIMTKTVESHILTFSNLLSIAVNGAHVKMADLRRWARS